MNDYPEFQTTHLTPPQIEDYLIGDLAAAPAAHLATCSECAERVLAARSPLESFRLVATAWSERRSAALPAPSPISRQSRWQLRSSWATACLTLAVGIALSNAFSGSFSGKGESSWPLNPVSTPVSTLVTASSVASFALNVTTAQAGTNTDLQSAANCGPAIHHPATQGYARHSPAPGGGSPEPAPSAAQIAAENHMLQAIEAASNPSADNPVTLGLVSLNASDGQPSSVQD
jgi:hypothetical protein